MVRDKEVTLKELSGQDFNAIQENDDMAVIIALSWEPANAVTAEQVRSWPFSVQKELYANCNRLLNTSDTATTIH